MLSEVLDITAQFKADTLYTLDLSNWDNAVIQLVGLSAGTITFNATNDGGGVTGVTDGDSRSVGNLIAVQVTNLNTGTAVTSATGAGLYRAGVVGRYLQLTGSGVTITKILVYLSKIS